MQLGVDDSGEVSTHSRPKAAGEVQLGVDDSGEVSTHSRLKAAGLLKY